MRRLIFLAGHQAFDRGFLEAYRNVMDSQWWPEEKLVDYQERLLKRMIRFAYNEVPYYHRLFRELRLKPEDIRKKED